MKDKNKELIIGAILGVFAGTFGNIWVTALYRIIDKNPNGHNGFTFFIGLLCFVVFLWILYMAINRKSD